MEKAVLGKGLQKAPKGFFKVLVGVSAPPPPSGDQAFGAIAKVKWLEGVPGSHGRARRKTRRTRKT